MPQEVQTHAAPVRRFTLVSWLSIYGRDCHQDFVKESDYAALERENAALRSALTSAREELVRQRAIWTNGQNDLFAISCIVRELERIDAALSLSGASGKAQKASPPSAQADCSQGAIA